VSRRRCSVLTRLRGTFSGSQALMFWRRMISHPRKNISRENLEEAAARGDFRPYLKYLAPQGGDLLPEKSRSGSERRNRAPAASESPNPRPSITRPDLGTLPAHPTWDGESYHGLSYVTLLKPRSPPPSLAPLPPEHGEAALHPTSRWPPLPGFQYSVRSHGQHLLPARASPPYSRSAPRSSLLLGCSGARLFRPREAGDAADQAPKEISTIRRRRSATTDDVDQVSTRTAATATGRSSGIPRGDPCLAHLLDEASIVVRIVATRMAYVAGVPLYVGHLFQGDPP